MAQLVEQRIRNAWVAGSSPAIGLREKEEQIVSSFFFVVYKMIQKLNKILIKSERIIVFSVRNEYNNNCTFLQEYRRKENGQVISS